MAEEPSKSVVSPEEATRESEAIEQAEGVATAADAEPEPVADSEVAPEAFEEPQPEVAVEPEPSAQEAPAPVAPAQPVVAGPTPVAPGAPTQPPTQPPTQEQLVARAQAAADQQITQAMGLSEAQLEELRANEVAFSWQAAEFVQHHKGLSWYAGLIGGMVALAGITLLLHDWTTTVAFVVMGVAVVVYAHKAPKTLLYELTPTAIAVDGKQFPFKNFRSFGVLPEAEWHTIDLDPIQRFSPRMTIIFGDEDFEDIVGHLELHLPRIDRKPDIIERLTRYLRF